ncbi:hypothetical protein Goklo_019709 [Gossypium klotzschianum]|uniref:Serine aminopeptidase S33 domain-containing protein n=1 Tax=Gossypium klotzschianum TaxID=34286 RepID=A0A7J8UPR1_9ROSI|nr:hypothetical protein [Gossypium klotzschianum]
MAAISASTYPAAGVSPFSQRRATSSYGGIRNLSRILAVSTERGGRGTGFGENGKHEKQKLNQKVVKEESEVKPNIYANPEKIPEFEEDKKWLKDYFEECKEMIRSDGGPPRWFSPLECSSSTSPDCPLLLFLPELVKIVERTVRSENYRSPNRPIYLVGESIGACLAISVAARNPDMDLVLVLSNPATSFSQSQLQPLIPLLEMMPDQFPINLPYILSNPLRVLMDNVVKRGPLPQIIGELSQDLATMSSYLPVLADIVPRQTLLWKLNLLKSGSACGNSCLHAVKAQLLILCSGRDQLLPSQEESQRLQKALPDCEIRMFEESGHFLFLEDNVDLVTIIKGASFYRRGKHFDCASDFMPPTPSEFKKLHDSISWVLTATSPVMLSTLEDGKVVRGLAGIPSEGPVLFVGYHMLMGFEVIPLVAQIMMERNILVRGIAHPAMFVRVKDRRPPEPELSDFDVIRVMGAVPVSAANFYKLMSSKSHALLYPGGVREALHRKGEEYKLFWPDKSEFVRMAARFGAKIIPFGVVGEDDFAEMIDIERSSSYFIWDVSLIFQIILDYNDLMKIPWRREEIERVTSRTAKLRTDASGEIANQQMHIPWVLPKFPGRFYYYFGKPILTEEMKVELREKKKCDEMYLHIKSEVEGCIDFLKNKREKDPYRNLLSRVLYQASHPGSTSPFHLPSFDL